MGDDRYGRTPRPGGLAPWERYPADDETQSRTGRRSRHTDSAAPGSAPISVQDLVERVDSERKTRRRRRADDHDEATAAPDDYEATGSGRTHRPAPGNSAGWPETGARRAAPPEQPAANGSRRAPNGDAVHTTGSRRTVPADPAAVNGARRTPAPEPAATNGSQHPAAPADPVTEELPVVAPEAPRERAKAPAPAPVSSPADYPTTALPAAVGAKPLSRLAAGRKRRNKRMKLAARSSAIVFSVIAILITGGGWSYLKAKDNNFNNISALQQDSPDIVDADAQYGDENFLIIGTDTRAGVNSSLGAGTTEDAEGARADTVMLVNIPKSRDRVVAVSFPRDLDVTRPVCEGWDNDKGKYTGESFSSAPGDKLNAVYALGGPKCLTNVIQRMSGLKINHFVGIDFAGFETMVDTIGGVEVCSAKPLVDDTLGTILTNPGKQMVSGATALDYVRARHVVGEERSDYDRINRQQRFLSSLLRSALSSRVLFDPGKLNGFIDAFTKHTFMDNVNVKDLLMLGQSLKKVDAGAITFLTVPTAGTTSYGNEIPRESDIKAIFRAIIDDQPLPGEKKQDDPEETTSAAPTSKPKLLAVDPSTVSLQVSNGSGIGGVASTTATKLSNQGFQIYSTGNYAEGTSTKTKVRYSAGQEAAAATVASAIPGSTLEATSGMGSIVEVVIGSDFAGTIKAPTAFGSTLPDAPTDSVSAAPVTLPSDLEHVNAADDTCK
ncbi:LCP family protein [Nocardia huaxiensis]|uniref:LCP family protein n=1 Tax=Nocardia huaxiensis TaxID=2755382 RepID=UPI001E51A925|nr:LCP family protein [Nocardia huaxiensis]UFS95174.1 LCP family protein [Nocardia huaxiensis]